MANFFTIALFSLGTFLAIGLSGAQAVNQPELIIDSVAFDSAKGYSIPTVKNIGNAVATSKFFVSQAWLQLDESGTGEIGKIEFAGNIAPGKTQTPLAGQKVSSAWLPPSRAVKVRLTVDADNTIAEMDEGNNKKILDRPLPDLKIASVSFDSNTLKPSVTVTNVGNAAVTRWSDTQVGLYLMGNDGKVIPNLNYVKIASSLPSPPFLAGGSFTVTFDKSIPPGSVRYSADIRSVQNLVPLDINEDNNLLEGDVPDLFLPDLKIDYINFASQTSDPIVAISNIGEDSAVFRDTNSSVNISCFDNQGDRVDPCVDAPRAVLSTVKDSLFSGESIKITSFKPLANRVVRIDVNVELTDANDNAVKEKSANNNSLVNIGVPLPDLVVESVDFDPKTGAAIPIVKNQGTVRVRAAITRGFNAAIDWFRADGTKTGERRFVTNIQEGILNGQAIDIEPGQAKPLVPGNINGQYYAFDSAWWIPPADAVKVKIYVDLSGRITEADETNNDWKEFDRPLPDLVIEKIDFNPVSGGAIPFVKNQGSVRVSTDFNAAIEWIGANGQRTGQRLFVGSKGQRFGDAFYPAPGEEAQAFFPSNGSFDDAAWIPPADAVKVRVTADLNNRIPESSEDNNELIVDRPLPDLVVEAVNFDPAEGYPIPVIKNQGSGAARYPYDSFRIKVQWLYSDNRDAGTRQGRGFTSYLASNFGPGEKRAVIGAGLIGVSDDFLPGPNAVRARVTVDDNGDITESDEANNEMTVDVPLPDFVFESVIFDATGLPVVTVKNVGAEKGKRPRSQFAVVVASWLKADGTAVRRASQDLSGFFPADLAPGQTNTFSLTPDMSTPAEAAKLSLLIDSYNVNESNWDNNRLTVDRPLPDLVIESATFHPADEYVRITVKNQGSVAVRNGFSVATKWLRTDGSLASMKSGGNSMANYDFSMWLPSEGIAPGQAITSPVIEQENLWAVQPGQDAVKFHMVLDEVNNIPEANEDNNIMVFDRPLLYPIPELGNCLSKEDCRRYCGVPENTSACAEFGADRGLLTEEEAEAAEDMVNITDGPGGCTTRDSCAEFCEQPANIEACLNYAEQNNWMSADDLSKARKVAGVLAAGGSTPGSCTTPASCKTYCSDNSHAVECVNFGKTAGLLTAEEAAEAEKVAPLMQAGQTPGGKQTREETQAYCEAHWEECDQFFEQAGVKMGEGSKGSPEEGQKEDVPSIFKDSSGSPGAGPGDCKTKAECDAYCDSHPGECDTAVQQAGGEVKEATATCATKEECAVLCDDPANKGLAACQNVVIKEEPEGSSGPTEGPTKESPLDLLRSDIQGLPAQGQECVKQIIGEETFNALMSGGVPEKAIKREEIQSCFEFGVKAREEEEELKMQKKPDDPDMGNPPPQSQSKGVLNNLASLLSSVLGWLIE